MKFNFWSSRSPSNTPRCMLLGSDSAGKTTLLFTWELKHVVTTIPTIGFNWRTLDEGDKKLDVVDFGGCDKMAPLARHYIDAGTGILYLHDLSDVDRVEESMQNLRLHAWQVEEAGAKYVWVMLTKQDLVPLVQRDARRAELYQKIKTILEEAPTITWKVFDESGLNNLDWLRVRPILTEIATTLNQQQDRPTPLSLEKKVTEKELRERIDRQSYEDEPVEQFWQGFLDADLPRWNHRSHLRAGYIMLLKSAAVLDDIWTAVDGFLEHIERLRKTRPDRFRNTKHRTMTMFWLHVLQLAILEFRDCQSDDRLPLESEFKDVLLIHPRLADTSYWRDYYSESVMFTPEAKENWCLPDKTSLPTKVARHARARSQQQTYTQQKTLPKQGDDADGQARLIDFALFVVQYYLNNNERRGKVIAAALSKLQRSTLRLRASNESDHVAPYSETQAYFWIQIVHATLLPYYSQQQQFDAKPSNDGHELNAKRMNLTYPQFRHIFPTEPTLCKTYYSAKVWNSVNSRMAFVNPDLKSLPNVFPGPGSSMVAARFMDVQVLPRTDISIAGSDPGGKQGTLPLVNRSPEETALRVDALVAAAKQIQETHDNTVDKDDVTSTHLKHDANLVPSSTFHHTHLLHTIHVLLRQNTKLETGKVDVTSFISSVLSVKSSSQQGTGGTSSKSPLPGLQAANQNLGQAQPTGENLSESGVTHLLFYARMALALSSPSQSSSSSQPTVEQDSFHAFLTSRPALLYSDLPFQYYRPETWFSLDARIMIVPPDVNILPGFEMVVCWNATGAVLRLSMDKSEGGESNEKQARGVQRGGNEICKRLV